eukprot:2799556-Prymnesium_polylepis.1
MSRTYVIRAVHASRKLPDHTARPRNSFGGTGLGGPGGVVRTRVCTQLKRAAPVRSTRTMVG